MTTDWPRYTTPDKDDLELAKILYQAKVTEAAEERKAENPPGGVTDADVELEKATWDAENTQFKAFQDAIYELTKAAIDRVQARAELIEKAAATIGTLYAGLLALVFSVDKNQLLLRGVVPTAFLGLAIVLAMVYLAFLSRPPTVAAPVPHSSPRENQMRRLRFFIEWVSTAVYNRGQYLRAAVVSLGVGVALLPLPFIHFPSDDPPVPKEKTAAIAWPSPPADIADAELAKILYQAQVQTAAEQTPTPASPAVDEKLEYALIPALIGLALVGWALWYKPGSG